MSTTRHTREELTYRILRLQSHGLSCRVIARALDVSRWTVWRVVDTYARPVCAPRTDDPSSFTPSSPDEDPV